MFRKDPSRPGGGLFVATEKTAAALGSDIPKGTMVVPDEQMPDEYKNGAHMELPSTHRHSLNGEEGTRGDGSTSTLIRRTTSSSTDDQLSSFVPLTTPLLRQESSTHLNLSNVNPNIGNANQNIPHGVQVLNVLDQPTNSASVQQYAAASSGLLEGIPQTMFEWGMYKLPFEMLS